MIDYMVREKRNPNHTTLIAGWSQMLGMYVMSELENYSFVGFCYFYEITKETYDRFEEPDFDPPGVRMLFSESPVRKMSENEMKLREKFFGR